MTTQTLTFPLDLTEELYEALKATALALASRIEPAGNPGDNAVLARTTELLQEVEALG